LPKVATRGVLARKGQIDKRKQNACKIGGKANVPSAGPRGFRLPYPTHFIAGVVVAASVPRCRK